MKCVNIIGAGLAGLSAAIRLAELGVRCNLISPQHSERAQSVLAEGGINACLDTMGENDTWQEHCEDTLRGGVYLADPAAVEGLTSNAPDIVRWLARIGAPLQMKDGAILQRNFGGQKKKRTAYAKSSTGKILMSTLIDECRRHEARGLVRRYAHHLFYDLAFDEDGASCVGTVIRDDRDGGRISCPGSVILACGGLNGLFPGMTTGTTQDTGDAAALMLDLGAEMADLEFIQYHPTTVQIPGKRMLISEAARGEGGRLFIVRDGKPWYFMEDKYPELGNLMPRDVISREMILTGREKGCEPQVYLDLTGLSGEIWRDKLPDMRDEIIHYLAVDPAASPVPVSPGIHFFMGGINVDISHRTTVRGVYAAGECACIYHGANRLGGNSMLGAIYGGRVAAETAWAEARELKDTEPAASGRLTEGELADLRVSGAFGEELKSILLSGLGIIRDESSLLSALEALGELRERRVLTSAERMRLNLGRAMLMSALERRESRGAHTRSDFPERNDGEFKRTTVALRKNGEIQIGFRSLPERSGDRENDN